MQVNKYDIRWQIVRSKVKGKDISIQFETVKNFLIQFYNEENKQRVINWIEGVKRGHHKNQSKQELCDIFSEEIDYLDLHEDVFEREDLTYLLSLDIKDVELLYKDLFKRTEKWLTQGYNHEMQNSFIFWIYCNREDLINKLSGSKYDIEVLQNLIDEAKTKKNTYKFIFH